MDRALEIARGQKDLGLELRILSFACDVEVYHGLFEECFDTCLKGIELAAQVDDPRSELLVHFWAAALLIFLRGIPEDAARHVSAALSAAQRLRHHFYLARVFYISQTLAQLKGDWTQARERSDKGLAVAPREFRLLSCRSLLEFEQGNFEVGINYLDRMEEAVRPIPTGPTLAHGSLAATAPNLSRISGHDHGLDTSRRAADVVRSSPSAR